MARLLKKTSNSVKVLLIAVLIVMGGSNLFTKDDPDKPGTTIRVNTNIVNVFATVRDKKGTFRNDLTQEDFAIKEDGRSQKITGFSPEVDLPLTVGMVIDFSPSMQGVVTQLQLATKAFFKRMLRPGKDQLFILKFRDIERPGRGMPSFDGQIELVQDLTSKPVEIEKAVGIIGWGGLVGEFWEAEFKTMLADSINWAATKKLMLLPPESRKAIIVFGDGYHVDNHMDMAVLSALEAGAQIFSIRIFDRNFNLGYSGSTVGDSETGGSGPGKFGTMDKSFNSVGANKGTFDWSGIQMPKNIPGLQNMEVYGQNLMALSGRTGGEYFEYSGKKSLEDIYGQIEEELRSYYSLAYTSDSKNPGCRKIKLNVVKDGFFVHSRESYCPPGWASGKKNSSKEK
jgi:VWFA-related protein